MSSKRLILFIGVIAILMGFILGVFYIFGNIKSAVLVEWSTASEINTAGFYLYRSNNPAGPFEKVNEELIPASSDSLIGGSYAYEDTNVKPGEKYYYQLWDIDFNGNSTTHGPIEVEAGRGNLWIVVLAVAVIIFGILVLVLGNKPRRGEKIAGEYWSKVREDVGQRRWD